MCSICAPCPSSRPPDLKTEAYALVCPSVVFSLSSLFLKTTNFDHCQGNDLAQAIITKRMEVDSPRQYSRKDLLGACSFMASLQTEVDEEPTRIVEMVFHSPRASSKRHLPTITEEDSDIPEATISKTAVGK